MEPTNAKTESVTAKLLKPSELWEFAKIYEWQKIFDIFEIISESKQSPHSPPPSCFIPEAEFPLRLLALEQPYEDYDMDWYGLSKDHNKRCLRMKIHKKWNENPSQTMLAPKHRAEAKGAVVVINLSQLVWISIFHKSHLKWKYWNNWNGRWGRVYPWTMNDLFLSAKQKKI